MPIYSRGAEERIDKFVLEMVATERAIRGLEWLGQTPEVPSWHERVVSYAAHIVDLADGLSGQAFMAAIVSIGHAPKPQEGDYPPGFPLPDIVPLAFLSAIGSLGGDLIRGEQFYDPVLAAEGQRRGWRASDGMVRFGRALGRLGLIR